METNASRLRISASSPAPETDMDSLTNRPQEASNIRPFVSAVPRIETGRSRALRIGRFILFGGGPLHELPLIDVSRKGTCLMFPGGTHLAVGDVFEIVRPIMFAGGFALPHSGPRKVVARVKVIGLDGERRAVVQVLRGSVIRGYWAERG